MKIGTVGIWTKAHNALLLVFEMATRGPSLFSNRLMNLLNKLFFCISKSGLKLILAYEIGGVFHKPKLIWGHFYYYKK